MTKRPTLAFATPCNFLVNCIMSLKPSLGYNDSLLMLSLLVSGMGSNPSTLLSLYPKDLAGIGQSIELFMRQWCLLRGECFTVYGALCDEAFQCYLVQLPFSHGSLRQLAQSTLFFRGLLGVYGDHAAGTLDVEKEDGGGKRARVEDAEEENGVVAVKDKAAASSPSLLNHFLLAVQRALAWDEGVSGAAACQLLTRLIEVGSVRCRAVFKEGVNFAVGEKKGRVVSVSALQLLVLDLLQLLCGKMSRSGRLVLWVVACTASTASTACTASTASTACTAKTFYLECIECVLARTAAVHDSSLTTEHVFVGVGGSGEG